MALADLQGLYVLHWQRSPVDEISHRLTICIVLVKKRKTLLVCGEIVHEKRKTKLSFLHNE